MVEPVLDHVAHSPAHTGRLHDDVGICKEEEVSTRLLCTAMQGVIFPQPARGQLCHVDDAKRGIGSCDSAQNSAGPVR